MKPGKILLTEADRMLFASEMARVVTPLLPQTAKAVYPLAQALAKREVQDFLLEFSKYWESLEKETQGLLKATRLSPEEYDAYVRKHPPSPKALLLFAEFHKEQAQRQAQVIKGQQPRPGTLKHQLRTAGINRYADVKVKAPHLLERYSKEQLTQAISKGKSAKKI